MSKSQEKLEWVVCFDIPAMGIKDRKDGPYSWQDAEYHKRDIAGYEGVTNVRITSVTGDVSNG